jgi:tetratricopeptide (TPR) repeat protein
VRRPDRLDRRAGPPPGDRARPALASGDAARAQEHIELSMRLDPFSPLRSTQLGMLGAALFAQRRYAEAAARLREANQLNDSGPLNHAVLAACYGRLGQAAEARAALDRVRARTALTLPELCRNLVWDEALRHHFLESLEGL